MSEPILKWCSVCQKSTHNDAECWGLGTVVVRPVTEPLCMQPVMMSPPQDLRTSPELLAAIRAVSNAEPRGLS